MIGETRAVGQNLLEGLFVEREQARDLGQRPVRIRSHPARRSDALEDFEVTGMAWGMTQQAGVAGQARGWEVSI